MGMLQKSAVSIRLKLRPLIFFFHRRFLLPIDFKRKTRIETRTHYVLWWQK